MRRLFISIAAYCDPLLGFTIRSAIEQARAPGALRFGVVEQAVPGAELHLPEAWARQQVRCLRIPAIAARGPCWARALAMQLNDGEAGFLQIDSHTWFEPGWDERLWHWHDWAAARNPDHLISTYPQPFEWHDGAPVARPVAAERGPVVLAQVLCPGAGFAADHPVLSFEAHAVHSAEPLPARHLGAGALFGPGHLVSRLPYDPLLYFHGEEQALATRAWSHGWDLWHVPDLPLLHLYGRAESGPAARPLHWSAEHDAARRMRFAQREARSRVRLAALLGPADAAAPGLGRFGLGRRRSLADFAAYSGIDYRARRLDAAAWRPCTTG
jgi:Glycosyltransferase (GlcNAc)